jgi:hypothetical protein
VFGSSVVVLYHQTGSPSFLTPSESCLVGFFRCEKKRNGKEKGAIKGESFGKAIRKANRFSTLT